MRMSKEKFEMLTHEKKLLQGMVDFYSEQLQKYNVHKNVNGLIPYELTRTEEFQELQQSFDNAFKQLRNFNAKYAKALRKKSKNRKVE